MPTGNESFEKKMERADRRLDSEAVWRGLSRQEAYEALVEEATDVEPPTTPDRRSPSLLPADSAERKACPIASGVLDYFPAAIAEVARVSKAGNDQHNPGQPMHWAREKSTDHADCIARHLLDRGTLDDDGQRHSAKLAWRALAQLQLELEAAQGERPAPPAGATAVSLDPRHASNVGLSSRPVNVGPTCYLAGPMRGKPEYNFPQFEDAAEDLRKQGWVVISPAEMEEAECGPEARNVPTHVVNSAEMCRQYATRDTAAILSLRVERGDAVMLLPGWSHSIGARAEAALARWVKLPLYRLQPEPGTGRWEAVRV